MRFSVRVALASCPATSTASRSSWQRTSSLAAMRFPSAPKVRITFSASSRLRANMRVPVGRLAEDFRTEAGMESHTGAPGTSGSGPGLVGLQLEDRGLVRADCQRHQPRLHGEERDPALGSAPDGAAERVVAIAAHRRGVGAQALPVEVSPREQEVPVGDGGDDQRVEVLLPVEIDLAREALVVGILFDFGAVERLQDAAAAQLGEVHVDDQRVARGQALQQLGRADRAGAVPHHSPNRPAA